MKLRPESPGKRYEWYSFCSMHYPYDASCHICNAGSWRHKWATKASQILYKASPTIWRLYANWNNKWYWRNLIGL